MPDIAPVLLSWKELQSALQVQRQRLLDAGSDTAGIDKLLTALARESVSNSPDHRVDMTRWQDDASVVHWDKFLQNAEKEGSRFVWWLARDTKNRASQIQEERLPVWDKLPMQDVVSLFENSEFEVVQRTATRRPSEKLHSLSLFLRPRSAPAEAGNFSAHLMWVPDENILVIERTASPPALQGQGSLKQFLRGTLALAERIGATKIELGASDTAGALVWGKAGVHMSDNTRIVRDMRGEILYEFLGWSDFCAYVRGGVSALSRDPSTTAEKQALLSQVEALVQEGAPKSNLQQIARLAAHIESHPGQSLFLSEYAGYFDLADPAQMREVHKFIDAGRVAQPQQHQQQQQQQRRPETTQALRDAQAAQQQLRTGLRNHMGLPSSGGTPNRQPAAPASTAPVTGQTQATPRSNVETPEFYEIGRIVNPDSAEGRQFASFMEGLRQKILTPEVMRKIVGGGFDAEFNEPNLFQARYLLADEDRPNAYAITGSKPPVVVIHKGLVKDVKSLDELAGVLTHEWGHILAKHILNQENSKRQETLADNLAVRILAEANMNAHALAEMLTRWGGSNKNALTQLMQAIRDVHPLSENRAEVMEEHTAAIEREHGLATRNPNTAIPAELLAVAARGEFHSQLSFETAAIRDGYDAKNTSEKMAWLKTQHDAVNAQASKAADDINSSPNHEPTTRYLAGRFAQALAIQNSFTLQTRFLSLEISATNIEEVRQYHQLLRDLNYRSPTRMPESPSKGIASLSELASAAKYDSLSPTAKLEWLINTVEKQLQFARDLPSWDDINRDVIGRYSPEMVALWKQITIDPKDPEQVASYHRAFDRLLATNLHELEPCYEHAVSVLYGPKALNGSETNMLKPIGKFRELTEAVLAFEASKTPEEAGMWAERFHTLRESMHDRFSGNFFRNNVAIQRVLPSYQEIELNAKHGGSVEIPFLRHINMANALQSGNAEQRRLAAVIQRGVSNLLGGQIEIHETQALRDIGYLHSGNGLGSIIYPPAEPSNMRDYDAYLHRLIIDGDVAKAVIPPAVKAPEWDRENNKLKSLGEALQYEAEYMPRRIAWEKELLQQGVRWELLERNPTVFWKIYQEALNPRLTLEAYPYPFAEALVERLRAMPETQRASFLAPVALAAYEATSNGQSSAGIDPTHPYVSLLMENTHLSAGKGLNGTLYNVRFDMLAPTLPIAIRADQKNLFSDSLRRYHSIQEALHWARTGISEPLPLQASMLVDWLSSKKRVQINETIAAISKLGAIHAIEPAPAKDLINDLSYTKERKLLSDWLVSTIPRIDAKGTNPDPFMAFLDTLGQPAWGLAEDHPLRSYKTDAIFITLLRQQQNLYRYTKNDELPPHHQQALDNAHAAMLQHIDHATNRLLSQPLDVKIATLEEALTNGLNEFKKLPKTKEALLNGISTDIAQIASPVDRLAALEKLAFHSRNFVTQAQHDNLAKITVSTLVEALGRDDGTPAYQQRVKDALKPFLQKIEGSAKGTIIRDFATASESQPALTDALKNLWVREADKTQQRGDAASGIVEAVYERVRQNVDSRANTINFLIHPPTIETTDKLLDHLPQTMSGMDRHDEFSRAAGRYKLEEFHRNFWNSPMPVRVATMNGLLFGREYDASQVRYVTQRLLDRVLGTVDAGDFTERDLQRGRDVIKKAQKSSQIKAGITQEVTQLTQDAKAGVGRASDKMVNAVAGRKNNNDVGRLIVNAYLDTVADHNPKEAQLLASGLLAAEHAREPGQSLRMGQVLDKVLSHMGAPGDKLKQAIHSNPSTPADIRDDLKGSKTRGHEEARWDHTDKLRDAGLLDPTKTTHVGPIKGIGSLGITGFNTAPDGTQYADTVFRNNAAVVSEREFNFMLKAAHIIANADPDLLPVIDMIREARHSVRIETKASLAPKQNRIIEQVIDGVRGTVVGEDGKTYHLTHKVAPLVEVGEKYKRAEIAPGEHYLDLPIDTPQDRAHRRASGLFMLATQMIQRYAGMPMDQDRHGGNIKEHPAATSAVTTVGDTIYHYDHGMVELTLPSDESKRALGKVTAQAVRDAARGGDFMDHLLKRIQHAEISGETRSFLAGFTRDMLALGDYINEPGKDANGKPITVKAISNEQLAGVLGEALYGERTDPVIKASYEKALGPIARAKAAEYFSAARAKLTVHLENIPSREALQMPMLTKEEKAIVENRDYGLPRRLATQRQAIQSGASNGIGVAMGAYGLYSKFNDKDGTFHEDMNSGDRVRKALAVSGFVSDVANIGAGALSTAADVKTFQNAKAPAPAAAPQVQKVATEALKHSDKILTVGKYATKAAIPLAVATGALDASAGARAGDRERVAGAVGATAGGIVGGIVAGATVGMMTGALAGTVVAPGIGTIAIGVAAGLGGGIAGAIYGEEAARKFGSKIAGWMTGADDTFMDAMVHLDHATLKKFSIKSVEDVHKVLKSSKMDSVAHADANGDGKLTATELKQALEKARTTFIDNQLTEQLAVLEAKGLGKTLGDKNGKLTLDELKTGLKEKNIDLSTLIRDDKIDTKAITDALEVKAPTLTAPAAAAVIAAAKDVSPQAR